MEVSPRKGTDKTTGSPAEGIDMGTSRGDLRQGGDGKKWKPSSSWIEGSGGAAPAAGQGQGSAKISRRASGRKRKAGSQGCYRASRSKLEPSSYSGIACPTEETSAGPLGEGLREHEEKEDEEEEVCANKEMEMEEGEEQLMTAVAIKKEIGAKEVKGELVAVKKKAALEDEQYQGQASVDIQKKTVKQIVERVEKKNTFVLEAIEKKKSAAEEEEKEWEEAEEIGDDDEDYVPQEKEMYDEDYDIKEHVRALEVYQKQELMHHEIVRERLKKLENKKELNEIVGKFVDAMATLRAKVQRCNRRIAALEETNRKLRAGVANAISPP